MGLRVTDFSIDLSRLTAREHEVYLLVQEGLTNIDIGRRLGISTRTAEGHRLRVHRLLGLRRILPHGLRRHVHEREGSSDQVDLSVLSPRQREVYNLLVVDGLTSAEAAASLVISPRTVETYRARVTARLAGLPRSPQPTLPVDTPSSAPKPEDPIAVLDLRGLPGDILRAARAALGWTIRQAARESGISSVTLSKIESGPPRTTLGPSDKRILAAYRRAGVTIYRDGSSHWVSVSGAEHSDAHP